MTLPGPIRTGATPGRRFAIGGHRPLAALLAQVLLPALLVVSCGQSAGQVSGGARSLLQWHQVSAPPGFTTDQDTSSFTLTPGNGAEAYACVVAGASLGSSAVIWRTNDSARTWTQVNSLSPEHQITKCAITVDGGAATTLAVTLWWAPVGQQASPANGISYVTLDGGTHWRTETGTPAYTIADLATSASGTYAVLEVQDGLDMRSRLFFSTDRLHTWQPADTPLAAADQFVTTVAVSSFGPNLLASTANGTGFWSSDDGGRHWRAVSLPVPYNAHFATHLPAAGAPWTICMSYRDTVDAASPNGLSCSTDGGMTWQDRPGLNVEYQTNGTTQIANVIPMGLDSSGAFVAAAVQSKVAPMIYRLSETASDWQPLGSIPYAAFGLQYSLTGSNAALWITPRSPGVPASISIATYANGGA